MNIPVIARNFRTRGARSALLVASIAWLGFLLQPCAMAAPVVGSDVAAKGVELSVVTHHHGPGSQAEQCLHCNDGTSNSSLLAGGCEDTAAASTVPAPKPPDSGEEGWSPALPTAISPDIQRIVSRSATHCAERIPSPVSITTAFCVYLE